MRKKLLRVVAAALMAIVVTLPGGARPAQAFNPAVITQYLDLASRAYSLIKDVLGGGGSDEAIKDAVRQILAAIEASKTQILSHIDAIATADARACARHHVIEFADIERFSPETLQRWAQDATGCVTRIDSLIDVVGDKAQADLLGLALNTAGPIALAARARAGFSTDGLLGTLRHANGTVIPKLEPQCTFTPLWGDASPGWGPVEVNVRCTSYPGASTTDFIIVQGQRGRPLSIPYSAYAHIVDATSNQTSRAVALTVLPMLQ
ncbi:hypothetical protein ACN28C_27060 [Plantactinospora sp. WMMC1484]|uniref:hypothetical protein n=1 Tax=Plantactinospora sp. WMMC1484 TaxID=3404122 RepID=UPI003BF603DC